MRRDWTPEDRRNELAALHAEALRAAVLSAETALNEINRSIFAAGAPLGSDLYFKVRGLCCDVLHPEHQE